MTTRKPGTRRNHNKMVRRNLEGLLSKAYKYGELNGVELGMYIDYPEKEEFVWYESRGFSCRGQVETKKAKPKSRRYLPSDVERIIGSKNGYKNKKGRSRKNPPRAVAKGNEESTDSCLNIYEFPELPELNISILGRRCGREDIGGMPRSLGGAD